MPATVLVVALASVVALGAVGASAASLGGLRTSDLGAADAATSSHADGLTVQWLPARVGTTWVLDGLQVATVGAQPFAVGERVSVTIVEASGSALCEFSVTAATATASLSIDRAVIDAACGNQGVPFTDIDRVAVVAGS